MQRGKRVKFFGKIPLLAAAWLLAFPCWAGSPLEQFYGEFIGHATTEEHGQQLDRDLSVSIRPADNPEQFYVKWTTVTHKRSGKLKRKVYNIKFTPTSRPQIYSSAMKTNVFGGQVALDPLRGDPYVWARVKGNNLTVHALLITKDGGYEMQVYDRELNDQGLYLRFTRNKNGEPLRSIDAQLVRVAD